LVLVSVLTFEHMSLGLGLGLACQGLGLGLELVSLESKPDLNSYTNDLTNWNS